MKILYITNGITGSGGLERVLSVKASFLAEKYGHEVHILSLNEAGKSSFFNFSDKVVQHSIAVSGNPVQYLKSYVKGIKQMIQNINPDIISVCDDGLKGFFIPRILGRKFPIIYERHVSKLIENQQGNGALLKLKYGLMDFLAKDFDRFVVLTEGNKKEWHLKNVEVIPNPLPFFPERSADLSSNKIIAVGKQSYQKAYDLLLKSWSLVKNKENWELHIYGQKDSSLGLDDLAEILAVSKSVFFHDPSVNIEECYKKSSIFVLSSRFEGFGMVIIEAMAHGLPVISFDCPHGPADIITDSKNGFLIPNGNIDKFAQQLQVLMSDKNLRSEVGLVGMESVKAYSATKVMQQWDNLFKIVVQ